MTAHQRIDYSKGQKLAEPTTATAGGFILGSGLIGVVAFVWAVAMNPAITTKQMATRLLVAVTGSMLFGPMLLELLDQWAGIHFALLQSQLAICLIPAAFLWVIMSIISHQFDRWNNSKNPMSVISRDIRNARRGGK